VTKVAASMVHDPSGGLFNVRSKASVWLPFASRAFAQLQQLKDFLPKEFLHFLQLEKSKSISRLPHRRPQKS